MRSLLRRFRLLGLALVLLVGVTSCRSFRVRSDWDEAVAFDGLRRYAWLEPPVVAGADPFADNSLLRNRVRAAIETNLTGRGFERVENPADADFLVTYGVLLDEKLKVNGGVTTYGGYAGYGPWPIGMGATYGSYGVRTYQDSTLIIDFLNPASQDLVWRGWASGILQTRDRDPGSRRFEGGIKAVLDAYPPKKPDT